MRTEGIASTRRFWADAAAGAAWVPSGEGGSSVGARSSAPTTEAEAGVVGGVWGGAAATPASSASPMTTSTSPTWIFWPAAAARRKTMPARGAGISTTALSVSTSTSGWSGRTRSPSWTSQRTISPSWIPSPTSGKRNSSAIQTSKGQDAADSLDHTLRRRQVVLFQLRQWKHRVKTGDALHRSLQRQERFFVDLRHNLGA